MIAFRNIRETLSQATRADILSAAAWAGFAVLLMFVGSIF